MFENSRCVEPAHASQHVHQVGDGQKFSVPGLPETQDRLGGTRPGREERDVPVNVEPLGQQPPVVALRVRRVEELGQRVEHRLRQPEPSGLVRHGVVVGDVQQPLLLHRRLAQITVDFEEALASEAVGRVLLRHRDGQVQFCVAPIA